MNIKELFATIPLERRRKPLPPDIIKKVIFEVNKIKKIPYKQASYKGLFWKNNPYKDDVLKIDLPVIEIESLKKVEDVRENVIFYDEKRIKKEKLKIVKDSCVVVHKGEIMIVYINSKTDKALLKATEKLEELGSMMDKYYPVKSHTFYSGMFEKTDTTWRYHGKNWMDGMIRYLDSRYGKNKFTYQPRNPEAFKDKEFLFNLVYSFSALYELEKRYAPAIAKYRFDKANKAGFPRVFPNLPLEYHCSTSCGSSLDFASSLHGDSGIVGITETIIWTKPTKGEKQYFVSPSLGLVFDLSEYNAIILQPPDIPHGTVQTENHGGYGFVNITKANCVADAEYTKEWFEEWDRYLGSKECQKDFKPNVDL